jgi:hypothetical protein
MFRHTEAIIRQVYITSNSQTIASNVYLSSTSRNMQQDTVEVSKLVVHSLCEQTFECCVVTDKTQLI